MRGRFILILLVLACAHKAPPIAKDRLSPKLIRIEVLNSRQLQLTFSENIDTAALTIDSIAITSAADTLDVLQAYPSLSASEVVLITESMKNVVYDIRGAIFDEAENKGNFENSFSGSVMPDTISPWVVGHSQGRNKNEFFLRFSEAMDTTSLAFSVIPRRVFIPVFTNSRYIRFVPETPGESLGFDTTYYLYLKNATDISGNRTSPFVTAITPDTVYRPVILQGKTVLDDTLGKNGLALLERTLPVAIALVQKGEFGFEVRDSLPFDVKIICDGFSGTATVRAGEDNIVILKRGRIEIDPIID